MNRCRLHGEACHVPWGYDKAHTDSLRPYTVEELSDRMEAPHRHAYPTARDYERGFYLWRAMRLDDRLTRAEEAAREPVLLARLGIAGSSFQEVLDRLARTV